MHFLDLCYYDDRIYHIMEMAMENTELLTAYNYDSFVPEKFMPWMRFAESPKLGERAPDFPLWHLDGTETYLSEIWSAYKYTVVEFGSFT